MKKIILAAFFIAATVQSMGLTLCPTVSEIKNSQLNGWIALDINDDQPIGNDQWVEFQHQVLNFGMAEWLAAIPYSAQCYYILSNGAPAEVSLGRYSVHQPLAGYWKAQVDRSYCKQFNHPENCDFDSRNVAISP